MESTYMKKVGNRIGSSRGSQHLEASQQNKISRTPAPAIASFKALTALHEVLVSVAGSWMLVYKFAW